MTAPHFGIQIIRDSNEPRPTIGSDMSVVGLCAPSVGADDEAFPYDSPVMFNSNDPTALANLGEGPLKKAVLALNQQLGEFQVAARVVAVRVEQGETEAETIANILGSQDNGSGIYAFLRAGNELGVIPRILGCPGFTGSFERNEGTTNVSRTAKPGGNTGNGVMTLADPEYGDDVRSGTYRVRAIGGARAASADAVDDNVGNGTLGSLTADANAVPGIWRVWCSTEQAGGGVFVITDPNGDLAGTAIVGTPYNGVDGLNFTISDGSVDFEEGDEFEITVTKVVPANGGLFSVTAPNGDVLPNATVGTPYTGEHVLFTIADGSADFVIGDGFDVQVVKTGGVAEANPICAALPAVCAQLLAHAVVGGPGTNLRDALDWRETLNSDRLIAVDNWHKIQVGTETEFEDGAARVIGLGVRVDYMFGGIPSHSWANRPLVGILGLKRYDAFSLTDGATDGQILLENQVGITSRGELGVETAIASSGFTFIGTDNAGADPLWRMYNVTRMRDYIHLGMLRTLRARLGTTNITPHGVDAVLNDMTFFLRDLKADDHLLGYRVGFEKDKNSPEELRLGHFRVYFQAEEPPVLKRLTIDSRRHRPSLEQMLNDIIVRADTLVA